MNTPSSGVAAPFRAAALSLAALAASVAFAALPPAPDIGVCAVIKQFHTAEQAQKRIEIFKAAGINFVRTDFAWRFLEREKGRPEFANYDRMVAIAEKNGIWILGLISHTPAWAAPIADHLDEWLGYVEQVVRRYPQIRHWEVFNEPNLESFWGSKPDPAGYAKLLRLTYAKIKAIDPSLFVVSGGLAGGNNASGGYAGSYAQSMFAAGITGAFDAFGIHPYRFPHAPEESEFARNTYAPRKATLEEMLGRYRALMDAHGAGDKPVWITECGYSAVPGRSRDDGAKFGMGKNLGVTDAEQADFLPRSILLAFQYGASNWMWFTTEGAERNPDNKEDWFGLLHRDLTPRPAYHALKSLRRAYPAGSTLIEERYLKEPVYRLAWKRPDGRTAWALWIADRGARRDVTLAVSGAVTECFDAIGERVTLNTADGRVKATLSGRMLYIIGPESVAVTER
jgi:hypothetical protein